MSCDSNPPPPPPPPPPQACMYDKKQGVDTPLGKANNNTLWEIIDLTAENFQFSITYKGGQDGRCVCVCPFFTLSARARVTVNL